MVGKVRDTLGPITVLHWNAYGSGAGNVLAGDGRFAQPARRRSARPLDRRHGGAPIPRTAGRVLATNGGLGLFVDQVDTVGAQSDLMGLSIANSAKHKLVRLLAKKLAPEGVFVGEVMVTGGVKGSAFDQGNATVDPATVAAAFWDMYQARTTNFAKV